MQRPFEFDAKPFVLKGATFLKLPKDFPEELLGQRVHVALIRVPAEGDVDKERSRRATLLDDIHAWMLALSNEEPDIVVTPRTVANNFSIGENDAVQYLSILEADGKVASSDSKGYLIYRVKREKQ